jgi:putative hemolysin
MNFPFPELAPPVARPSVPPPAARPIVSPPVAGIRPVDFPEFGSGRYLVRLAQEPGEVRAAQRLRYEVFLLESAAGTPPTERRGLDEDRFDFVMDHLLVVDRTTDVVVGTYRLQDADSARRAFGFYSATEFRLGELGAALDRSVEIGRACVARGHRDGAVMSLLWRGIVQYLRLVGARAVFGCCSVAGTDPLAAMRIYRRLRREGYLHPLISCPPHPDRRCEVGPGELALSEDAALPPLFAAYLDLGARVVSPPALDVAFGVVDFLTLLEVDALEPRAARHFGF